MRLIIATDGDITADELQELVEKIRSICKVVNVLKTLCVIFVDINYAEQEEITAKIKALPHVYGVHEDGIVRIPESPIDPLDGMRW